MRKGLQASVKSFVCALLLVGCVAVGRGQEMDHHAAAAVPSTQLTIKGPDGKSVTLSAEELAALPHRTVSVMNGHTKTNERYSGVPLNVLLGKVGVPAGEQVKGKWLLAGVVAEGTDRYAVLYGLTEVDPALHSGEVLVADSVDNHKLDKDGAFKLVATEDKRPARWVRNLTAISVIEVKP